MPIPCDWVSRVGCYDFSLRCPFLRPRTLVSGGRILVNRSADIFGNSFTLTGGGPREVLA
jgi:hypothetical protein